jgi:hypothetical protein
MLSSNRGPSSCTGAVTTTPVSKSNPCSKQRQNATALRQKAWTGSTMYYKRLLHSTHPELGRAQGHCELQRYSRQHIPCCNSSSAASPPPLLSQPLPQILTLNTV